MGNRQITSDIHIAEREALDIHSGKWGSIDKEQYRQYGLEQAVSIPVLQGVAAFAAIGTPVTVIFWMIWGWKVGLSAGCITASLAFAVVVVQGIVYSRGGLEYSEYWQSEDLHRNTQKTVTEKATVRVEVVDYASNPAYPIFQNDEMRIDHDTLAIVAHPDTRLSKRGLMDIGIGDDYALRILQELLAFKYIKPSEKKNDPSEWTNKGLALCRTFSGGGGGGGGVVVDVPTSEICRVGEG